LAQEKEGVKNSISALGLKMADAMRSFSGPSDTGTPITPLIGGPRLFLLLLYISVIVAVSLEFFASQRVWYGSWDLYNTYVFTVSGVFILLGMIMMISSACEGRDDYRFPISRFHMSLIGVSVMGISGIVLAVAGDSIGAWAIPLSILLMYGFVMIVLGTPCISFHDGKLMALYCTGLVLMVLVPVHEAFGVAVTPASEYYPFTLLNLFLLTTGIVISVLAIQYVQSKDGFMAAWLMGALVIFLIAFHEQTGIIASETFSYYDRTMAMIGIAFSFVPLAMYLWRERVYIYLWNRLRVASARMDMGDYPTALAMAEEAIRQCSRAGIEDRFALPWSIKADAHYRMKENEKAQVYYEVALKIEPRDSTSWLHLGIVYMIQGKKEDSMKAFDESIKANPNNGYAWNNKGTLYQSLGMDADAIICFDKAIQLVPDSFDAHINKAKLLSKMGRNEEALAEYQIASNLKPESEVAKDGVKKEFHRAMCLDQINGWEKLGLDTTYLRSLLDNDPANFVRKSKQFLADIVDEKTKLSVQPSIEHIDVGAIMKDILRITQGEGVTLERLEEETRLSKKHLILPLALLMETDHMHFASAGRQQVYVSKGKVPETPPEPPPPPPKPVVPEKMVQEKPKAKAKPRARGSPVPIPVPTTEPTEPATGTIPCPGCGLMLRGDEARCPRCDLPLEEATIDCPICGEDVQISALSCPKCGAVLKKDQAHERVSEKAPEADSAPASGKPPKPQKKKILPSLKRKKEKKPTEKEEEKKKPEKEKKAKKEAKKEIEKEAPPKKPKERKPLLFRKREKVSAEPTASILVFRRKK